MHNRNLPRQLVLSPILFGELHAALLMRKGGVLVAPDSFTVIDMR